MHKPKLLHDRRGQRFGRLVVVEYAGSIPQASRKGSRGSRWQCRCDCGKLTIVPANSLRNGNTRSCGCLLQDHRRTCGTHRQTKSREYTTWRMMRARCLKPHSQGFPYYGGRGIAICDRWKNSFENFLADMGSKPRGLTIERLDNNGPYSPDNCVWATQSRQCRNMRTTVRVTFKGKTKSLSDWADQIGIRHRTLHSRLFDYGWTVERAFTTPADSRKHPRR